MLPDALFWNVHMYGIMIAVGILACFLVLYLYSKRLGVDTRLVDFAFYDGVFSIVVGFGAAALVQATLNYIAHPELGFRLGSGITVVPGLIGGAGFFLLVYFLLRKRLSLHLLNILPIIPCCITVAHAFGRIGCFFAGCCYGRETDSVFGVVFKYSTRKVLPTQLFEAVFLFLLFAVLTFLVLKRRFPYTLSVYLVAYGIFRFILEFFRGDDRGQLFGGALSPSQVGSILYLLLGVGWFFLHRYLLSRRTPQDVAETPEKHLSE